MSKTKTKKASDVEGGGNDTAPLLRKRTPHSSSGSRTTDPSHPSNLTEAQLEEIRKKQRAANRPFEILKSLLLGGAALWGLHGYGVYHEVVHGGSVKHGWFKLGLVFSVAILTIKSYVELYQGKIQKQTITYDTHPRTTHAIIALLCLASLCFHIALWPRYGATTLFIMFMFGYGVLLQFMFLAPTYVQNGVGVVFGMWFLQQYQ